MERKSRETAGCADSSDGGGQQSWDQNSVWPEWNSPGGHCLSCRWVTPPFADLSKTTTSACKNHMLFQFLVNFYHQHRQQISLSLSQMSHSLHTQLKCCQSLFLPCCSMQSGTLAISHWKGDILVPNEAGWTDLGNKKTSQRMKAKYCTVQVVLRSCLLRI